MPCSFCPVQCSALSDYLFLPSHHFFFSRKMEAFSCLETFWFSPFLNFLGPSNFIYSQYDGGTVSGVTSCLIFAMQEILKLREGDGRRQREWKLMESSSYQRENELNRSVERPRRGQCNVNTLITVCILFLPDSTACNPLLQGRNKEYPSSMMPPYHFPAALSV